MWLKRPISDSSVFLVHLPDFIVLSTSCSQFFALRSVRYTLKRRLSMSQPRTIFRSSRRPSAWCFFIFMIGLRGHASSDCIGLKTVSRASGTACLIRAGLSCVSMHAWMKSSMKSSEMMSRGGRATASGSAFANCTFLSSL